MEVQVRIQSGCYHPPDESGTELVGWGWFPRWLAKTMSTSAVGCCVSRWPMCSYLLGSQRERHRETAREPTREVLSTDHNKSLLQVFYKQPNNILKPSSTKEYTMQGQNTRNLTVPMRQGPTIAQGQFRWTGFQYVRKKPGEKQQQRIKKGKGCFQWTKKDRKQKVKAEPRWQACQEALMPHHMMFRLDKRKPAGGIHCSNQTEKWMSRLFGSSFLCHPYVW